EHSHTLAHVLTLLLFGTGFSPGVAGHYTRTGLKIKAAEPLTLSGAAAMVGAVEPVPGSGPATIADVAARAARPRAGGRARAQLPAELARAEPLAPADDGRRGASAVVHEPLGRAAHARHRRRPQPVGVRPDGLRHRVGGPPAARVRALRPRRPGRRPARRVDAAGRVACRPPARRADPVHPRRRRAS